jgi:hypothetical protein
MKKRMRRWNFTLCFSLAFAIFIATLYLTVTEDGRGSSGGSGILYRVAAPILLLGGVGNISDS